MAMRITEAGRARVQTLEFVEQVRRFVQECQATRGASVETTQKLILLRFALALAGDPDPTPSAVEIERFCKQHHEEINAAIDKAFEKTIVRDCGSTVH